MSNLRWALAPLVALCACSSGEEPREGTERPSCDGNSDRPEGGAETTLLGKRVGDDFVALVDDEELPLERGPQGGYHVLVSTRFYVMSGVNWRNGYALVDPDTGESVGRRTFNIEENCAPGWILQHGLRMFVFPSTTARGRYTLRLAEIENMMVQYGPDGGILQLSTRLLDEQGNELRKLETQRRIKLRYAPAPAM